MSDTILLGLEGVLEEAGWDNPARLYVILGSEVEPRFAPLAEVEGHPCDVLHGMWSQGVRVPADAFGIALIVEGHRHLTLDEVQRDLPGLYADLLEVAADEGEDDIETAVETGWLATCSQIPPMLMPEDRRVRVRNSVAVLQSGWTLMVIRDYGGEPKTLDPVPPTRLKMSRVPDFMHLFLTGREPVD